MRASLQEARIIHFVTKASIILSKRTFYVGVHSEF